MCYGKSYQPCCSKPVHGGDRRTGHRLSSDTTKMKKSDIKTFHNLLNSIDPHISFTLEHERDGQLPFLDTLVSHKNGAITTNVYRKPTHTDRPTFRLTSRQKT